jgi:hypothetical protein
MLSEIVVSSINMLETTTIGNFETIYISQKSSYAIQ